MNALLHWMKAYVGPTKVTRGSPYDSNAITVWKIEGENIEGMVINDDFGKFIVDLTSSHLR